MKKILSLVLCLSLSLMLAGCNGNNYGGMGRRAKKIELNEPLNANMNTPEPSTIPEQVEALLNSYIVDGKYTKLTTLTYDDNAANYHAGVNARQRRTYYDETANALLMGNYDGTFTSINSGYAKTGTNDMAHYSNSAETITTSNLFAFTESDVDYTIRETTPLGYFDLLSELADEVGKTDAARWSIDDYGRYVYTAPEAAFIQNGSYNNGLLKMFQYFAAPMLLLNDGVGLQKVAIVEKGGYVGGESANILQIQLFSSTDQMVSYAYVLKGLTMEELTLSVSEILALTEEKVVKGYGVVIGYFGYNANTKAGKTSADVTTKQWTRFGIMLMDPETGEILLVRALSSIAGSGSYGAYKDTVGNDIAIGSVVEIRGNFFLNDEQISNASSGIHPQTGKKVVVMSTDCNSYLSIKGTKTAEELSALFASAPAITITTNEELANVASHINENYGKLIKLVGTAENPIYIGGSTSSTGFTVFNITVFKNASAQTTDETKYAGWDEQNRRFAINSDINKPNSGSDSDTWYSGLFEGVTGSFVGPDATKSQPPIGYTGTIYIVPTTLTSTYYFLSIVNYPNCELTPVATE